MTSRLRIEFFSVLRHYIGGNRYVTDSPGPGFLTSLAVLLVVAAPLATGSAQAGEEFVNFEEFTGPPTLAAIEPALTIGNATFTGGQIATNVSRLGRKNGSTVYGTAHFCSGCKYTITIEFAQPVSNISFMLMNARRAIQWFEIRDDAGGIFKYRLGPHFVRTSSTQVTLPSSGIRKIVIGQVSGATAIWWQLYIDNLRFTVDESQQYLVNFSAFVPHDSVPAAPTAFCLYKRNWLPPGRERVGRPLTSNARWTREVDSTPAYDRPPVMVAGNGVDAADDLKGNRRELYFAGDNRDFTPAATTYRVRQLVTVIPDETLDADGTKDGSIQNLAGEARAFAADAMADGIIDVADEDGIANDCRLFHKAHLAETDFMNVAVTRTGPQSLDIRFSGTLDSPLAGPAQVLGAIDWDFTLSLDNSTKPGRWTLSGAHDGFPAYEIYINETPVYLHDPGAPPYEFAKDVNKLLPPLDVEIAETSGDIP